MENTDLNTTRLTSSTTFGGASGEPMPVDSRVDVQSGSMILFEDTLTDLDELRFKCDSVDLSACADSLASMIVDDNRELNVDRFDFDMEVVAVALGTNTRMRGNTTRIAEGSRTSFTLGTDAEVDLRDVKLDGEAIMSGDGRAFVMMNDTTTGTGKFTFNGGIDVRGDTDKATIDISRTGNYLASMEVRDGDELRSAGNWIGSGDMDVRGDLILSGPSVTPQLRIDTTGTVRVESPIFVGRDISIDGTLEIRDNNGQTEFEDISSCPEGGEIVFEVADFTSLVSSSTSASFKIMGYPDTLDTSAFRCDVSVRDETTGTILPIDMGYSSVPGPAPKLNLQARHLLSTSNGACVYGDWGTGELTFGAGNCGIDAAVSTVPASILLLAMCAFVMA
jgi:hypothetical protein